MADTNRFLWTQRQDIGPSARSQHAMAYDRNRKRTVLFGGAVFPRNSANNLSDTWEWDGENWIQVSQFGPPPMAGHAMVYAGKRERVVLFAGGRGTWEWDGMNWTQVADIGPVFLSFAMVDDTQRERIVLFGSNDDVGSTWEWDGIEWTQESESGPGALLNHAMAYDAARRRVVVFGGWINSRLFRGTWEWDGTKWEQMSAFGPTARVGHAMAFESEAEWCCSAVVICKPQELEVQLPASAKIRGNGTVTSGCSVRTLALLRDCFTRSCSTKTDNA